MWAPASLKNFVHPLGHILRPRSFRGGHGALCQPDDESGDFRVGHFAVTKSALQVGHDEFMGSLGFVPSFRPSMLDLSTKQVVFQFHPLQFERVRVRLVGTQHVGLRLFAGEADLHRRAGHFAHHSLEVVGKGLVSGFQVSIGVEI